MLLACLIDPMIEDAEVKGPLRGLDLLPGNRHQNGIDVHCGEPGKNGVGLRRGTGGRIAQLASENQIGPAVNDQLSTIA
jgi:hypothetical protein